MKPYIAEIPLSEIYLDEEFNCRGPITFWEVNDLAMSIKEYGLGNPITVQPIADVKTYIPPSGYKYRIVAGHRRFTACKALKWETMTAIVKSGLSNQEALVINLIENVERKDLNVLQEAKALEKMYQAGIAREKLAAMLKKSGAWVQVRYNLLELPEDIQNEVAAGMINQYQVKQLYSIRKKPEKLYEAVRIMKEAKQRGEKVPEIGRKKNAKITGTTRKARGESERIALLSHLQKTIGNGIWTRIIAWTNGDISSDELHEDFKELGKRIGKPYFPPIEVDDEGNA